ncbi:eukaryotic translation initiation factor 4 gamma 1-like isoform X2 [Bacillus rossius redtenbacheri]|uniref:eukaryotic translation initiation factor 4 gamma 1-like isoform X2 n=1 Tax=Bacillus rossius redtenbacheri TaxID=93214 RepID=UPI002FDCBA4E
MHESIIPGVAVRLYGTVRGDPILSWQNIKDGTESFHVTVPSQYPPQQGGGPGPRSLHHHGAQGQGQGPPGPAPTSTPPGADMSKQGMPHMPQGEAWQQLPLNYTVTTQSRPGNTQGYFGSVRGPAPARMQPHRGQIVNVPANNVSQTMYSPHVPMPQMPPAMYAQTVSAQMPSQQMVYPANMAPMFANQPRHQNHTASAFYPQSSHQQIIMPGLFSGFASTNAPQGQYYTFSAPMRPGGGGTPGVGAAPAPQVVPGGCPPAMPQPGQLSLGMVPGGGGMGMPAMPGEPPALHAKTRRKHALDIVDPKTNKVVSLYEESNGSTPPRSGESPQPNTGPGSLDVVADFAARVAKAASEETSSSPQPNMHSPLPADGDSQVVSVSGPDTDSLPEQTISKQNISPIEETSHWKQNQSPSLGSVSSTAEKSDVNLVKTDIKIVSNVSAKAASYVASEVPQHIPVIINQSPSYVVSEPPPHVPGLMELSQHIPVLVSLEHQGEVPTPVVSALTNSPDVELQHRPAPAPPPASPRRRRGDAGDKMGGPNVAEFVPGEAKARKKSLSPAEEPPPQRAREVEKGAARGRKDADKKPRGREKSSQGREKSRRETTPAPVPVEEAPAAPAAPAAPQASETKQPNGDALIVEGSEGKAVQRSKQKKVAKMKDFNRKGSEKEGSDMDAFVEPVQDPPPAPAAPAAPVSVPGPAPAPAKSPSPPAPSVPEVVADPECNEMETDAAKEDQLESETEKLVAARNEENTKVTAAVLKEEPLPVIEAIQPKAVPMKKLPYKEDQWSPVNLDGKKKYERDFLMELQNDPQSRRKPDNLPDLEVVLKDGQNNNRAPRQGDVRGLPNRSQQDSFAPTFLRGSNMRGPPVTKRNSQQGSKQKGGGKPNMIHVSLSLNQDIKLRESENAWKPGRVKPVQLTEEEAKTEELYKKVRSVLNKLTPQKFHTLVSQVQALPIDNADRLQGVINIVFEKAVDEPNFSEAYAQMCKVLSDMQVKAERDKEDSEVVNFRKLLVTRCQKEFEKNSEQELDRDRRLKEIAESQDPDKKKELQIAYDDEERKVRMKSVGNIRFIGELFKLKMLTPNIILRCIKHLLDEGDEESLECLCKLVTTVGKDLEQRQSLAPYFDEMRKRSQRKDQISSRVRFMLQDVIDMRQNKWVPRRDDSNPKTIDQIQKEAEKETLEMHINLNSGPHTPRRQDDRSSFGGERKKRGGPVTNDDGWTNVVTKPTRYSVDTKKLAAGKESEQNMSLGSKNQFSNWGAGAGTGAKAPPAEKRNYAQIHPNMYSALDVEDKKPPPSMSSSRLPPGKAAPSTEKDRTAPFSKFIPDDLRQSRDSAAPARPGAAEEADQREGKPPKVTPAAIVPDPSLSLDQIQKKVHFLMDEFLHNVNYPEARQTVMETFLDKNMHIFVEECMNYLMEKSSQARQLLGKLMADLLKNCIIKTDHYVKGMLQFLEIADDMAIDIPKIWLYIAETIVPLFSGSEFSLGDFLSISRQTNPTKLIPEVFSLLMKEQGPNWVKEHWDSEGLKWSSYLPASTVDSFIKEHNLEFLTGGAIASLCAPATVNMDDVHTRLLQFLTPDESGHVAPFDEICAWIAANVGERVQEPHFSRVLSSAVFRSAIYKHGNSWKLQEDSLMKNHSLLTKYIDNKEPLELQCLFALQALVHELEHPQGLLCQIFQILWDENIISSDSFITWEKSSDPQELNGKAVALKSLTTFFTALKEADDDSSCEDS